MPISIISSSQANCEPSSPSTHCYDEITVRRAMQKLLSCDNSSEPSSPIDDDTHSSSLIIRPPLSFKNNHAKFSSRTFDCEPQPIVRPCALGELLLEWIAANCDGKAPTSQPIVQQIMLRASSPTNADADANDLHQVGLTTERSVTSTPAPFRHCTRPPGRVGLPSLWNTMTNGVRYPFRYLV